MVRIAVLVALALAWARPAAAFDVARPMGLYPPGNAPALAMLDSRIEVAVRGPIVEVVVVQRFRNTTPHATEATYIFPLPADAAVSAMALHVGTRTIRAGLETRDAAQRRYEAAVAAGVAGALLEEDRPDVFTQTVSAILPGSVVEVTLRYDTLARYQAGTWELVLPMVVAPRYVPGTASGRATTGSGRSPDTDRAPDASRVTPAGAPGAGGATAVAIHFVDAPSELSSPSHELGGTRSDATLADAHSDHDAIVRWRAPAASAGWVERDGDAGFAAVMVEAPAAAAQSGAVAASGAAAAAHRPPLRVIFAIDRAATTRGDAGAVEHPLVRALCGALDAADRVRVIGSDVLPWAAPDEALRGLDRSWAMPAPAFDLTRVLAEARPERAAIVLVTDGLVADDRAAIAAARRLGAAVHVIGIGPAPARATLHQLAAVTGGTLRYAVAGDDAGELARAVLADLATPPAPLAIHWGTLGASDVEPAVLPRLGAGQAMLVIARVKRVQAANARTRGELFAFEPLGQPRAVDGAITARGPLARRWARERLGDLIAAGRDPAAVVNHALAYGLVSPYTSLVAVGSDVVVQGGVKHSVAVPVSLPSGMQWPAVKDVTDPDAIVVTGSAPVRRETNSPAPVSVIDSEKLRDDKSTSVGDVVQHAPPPPVRAAKPTSPKAPPAHRAPPAGKKGAGASPPGPAKGPAKDRAGDDSDGSGEPQSAEDAAKATGEHEAARKEVSSTAAAPALGDEELHRLAESDAKTEAIQIEGRAEAITLSDRRRPWILSAALGGGVAVDHSARSLLALDVRLTTSGRSRFGAEGALWLVGTRDPQGRALATASQTWLGGRLELGLGAGVHVGNGIGPAAAARLGIATPLRGLAGYLRYDAALPVTGADTALEHAITLGLELSF